MIQNKDRILLTIKPEKGFPRSVDWSPDGTRLVVGDSRNGVSVWTSDGWWKWRFAEHSEIVRSVSWAANGLRIASTSEDGTFKVYDAVAGNGVLRGESNVEQWQIAWSPDSGRLAWSVKKGNAYIVRIGDATSGSPLLDCQGHTARVKCVSWSPQRNMLASGSDENTIRVWDVTTGGCLFCLLGHTGPIMGLCWSPNGDLLASASWDKTLRVWNTQTGICVYTCQGHTSAVWSVSWSPDGRVLASGSIDHSVILWSAENGRPVLKLEEHTGSVYSVAFSPEGSRLASASGDGTVRIWDVSDLVPVKKAPVVTDSGLSAYISRQAATIGYGTSRSKNRPEWAPRFPESWGSALGVLRGPVTEKDLTAVALFPDGSAMVTGSGDGSLRCWDLHTGQVSWLADVKHGNYINEVVISPDGTTIATASGDNTVGLWNAENGQRLRQLHGHKSPIGRVRWSPDGKKIASIGSSSNRQLRIWDALDGACLHIFQGHKGNAQALSWAPNGKFIAAGDNDGNIYFWDAETGVFLKQYNEYKKTIWAISWSPDNHLLLVGYQNGSVRVLDAVDGSLQFCCSGHKDAVCAVAWSPDGQFIATQSKGIEKRLIVWDGHTGLELKQFSFPDECWRLAWSGDSGFIVSSHSWDVYRFWDTRDLFPAVAVPVMSPAEPHEIEVSLRPLPAALAQMVRLHIYPPLSLVRDLLDLTAGTSVIPSLNTLITQHPILQSLIDLHWPHAARVGLVVLLLHTYPVSDWIPPIDATPTAIRETLTRALHGSVVTPRAPFPPLLVLNEALQKLDHRLIFLLTLLGSEAVAADPGLPLRLLPRIPEIPLQVSQQRRLLGVRVSMPGISGISSGTAPGVEQGGVGDIAMGPLGSNWSALLPTQLALPRHVQLYRHFRGELLFRTREMAEPPRFRPVVLLLDVSPPVFGPIEQITRLAAYTMAQSIRQAGLPVILVTTGEGIAGREWMLPLTHPADLLEIWVQRTLKPADVCRVLKLADVLAASLSENDSPEPIILLLSHPFFGAEDEVPKVKNLRGLFVQYPGETVTPVMSVVCEKWRSVAPHQANDLPHILGVLLA